MTERRRNLARNMEDAYSPDVVREIRKGETVAVRMRSEQDNDQFRRDAALRYGEGIGPIFADYREAKPELRDALREELINEIAAWMDGNLLGRIWTARALMDYSDGIGRPAATKNRLEGSE